MGERVAIRELSRLVDRLAAGAVHLLGEGEASEILSQSHWIRESLVDSSRIICMGCGRVAVVTAPGGVFQCPCGADTDRLP